MKKLKFTGKRYTGDVVFSGPGEKPIGIEEEVTLGMAERLVKDFPDRFFIVTDEPVEKLEPESTEEPEPVEETTDEPVKKEMKPKTNRSMKPTKTK